MRLLGWVIAARRPLSIGEISIALALEERPESIADVRERISVEAFLKRTCPNLLQIDVNGIVTIIHQSFKDFLLEVHQIYGQANIFLSDLNTVNLQIAKECINY